MGSVFLQDFLMISDIKTILFLAVLAALFALIRYLYKVRHVDFALLVLIGTGLGLILGFIIQAVAGFPSAPLENTFVKQTTTWFSLFGNGFISLISMLVVPLVMVSIMQVIISMEEGRHMGRLVKITILVTMTMVAVAAVVGIIIGSLFQLGSNSAIASGTAEIKEISSIVATLKGLIPGNIVSGMVAGNIIGLVIFSAIFGVAAWYVGQEHPDVAKPLFGFINGWHKTMINMALLILDFMPYAVIPLLANTIAQRGLSSIIDVGMFILAIYVCAVIQFFIQLAALALFKINPIFYLRKSIEAMILAFTSRSSVGCLPMTIETLTKKLGVNDGTASFVAGFGTTAGMQGCAGFFPALLIIYVANVTGTPIDLTLIVMTVIVVTIGSVGIAGIPGTATMAASVGLSGVGMAASFPMVSPILAIDPIIDMARTLLNVTGSITNALMVDKKMGTINLEVYQDMSLKNLKISKH